MPVFTNPSAIWGSLIFIGLIAVYFYRRRSKRVVVSSLMFFAKSKSTAEGGQKVSRFQTPLVFFLEILIFALLLLAVANPMTLYRGKLIPVSIILDDSMSMKAGEPASARFRAIDFLKEKIFSENLYRITLFKAGIRTQIIGKRDMMGTEALQTMGEWLCDSPATNMMEAVEKALAYSESEAVVVVITDHLDNSNQSEGIKWFAFGKSLNNLAITAANRTPYGKGDRCFFEFSNLSREQASLEAEIVDAENNSILEKISSPLPAMGSKRIIISVSDTARTIKARILNNDSADFDNTAVLAPIKKYKPVVNLSFNQKQLADAVKKALEATESVVFGGADRTPDVIISDHKVNNQAPFKFIIHNASNSTYLNKLVAMDKEHPLTDFLPNQRCLWSADNNLAADGELLITSGQIPLLWVENTDNNEKQVTLNYSFASSNMHQTSCWPVLFYNFVEWCSDSLSYNNENKNTNRSVNLCSISESSLLDCASSDENVVIMTDDKLNHFESVKWWFILAAFILLVIHQYLIFGRKNGYVY